MATALTITVPTAAGADYSSEKISAAATMEFANSDSRPVTLNVENGGGSPTVVTITRSGKFADGTTMTPNRTITVGAGVSKSIVDFPVREFGTTVGLAFSVTTGVKVWATY